MNPMVIDLLTAAARSLVLFAAGRAGQPITPDQATGYVSDALALAVFAWSLYASYAKRRKLVVAQVMPKGTTEMQVEQHIASGAPIPSVFTASDAVPIPIAK